MKVSTNADRLVTQLLADAKKLIAEGVGEFRNLALDTYTDEARFYSYRRSVHRGEPDYGRLVAAIALI